MAFENKKYWTEKRIAAFEKSKEARMQGLKKAQQATSGPPSPRKLAALYKMHASRRGKPLSEELIQKDRDAMLRKYQEDPEFYAQVVENNRRINSDPIVQQKHRDNSTRMWRNPEYVQKHREAMNQPHVTEKIAASQLGCIHTEEHNQKIAKSTSISQKKRWDATPEEVRKQHMLPAIKASYALSPSGLETYVKGHLDMLGVEYLEQYQISSMHVDFYIPSHNLVLEVYGCWWHGCEKCGKLYAEKVQRDRKREYFIRKQGYSLYIIWEHDIADSEHILQKILG